MIPLLKTEKQCLFFCGPTEDSKDWTALPNRLLPDQHQRLEKETRFHVSPYPA